MDIENLHKINSVKENIKKVINEYALLKYKNIKLQGTIENLSAENAKLSNNLKMLKKIIASKDVSRPFRETNTQNAIDMKQKINKFVQDIDKCIAILNK
ncbi:MAG: hypothetical protein ACQPRH_05410 [Solitalea-like symbiont of Tyrophagus putrescentiae]